MSWRDDLRPASFRGVPFHATQTGGTFGRRVVEHEYPNRDVPYVEDMGRAIRPITLTGFVLGPDYRAARDRLLAALETPGPGDLVHPWLGTLRVYARPGGYSESSDEGGIARFELSFIEAGQLAFPADEPDTQSAAVAAADTADEAAIAVAVATVSTDGPDFVLARTVAEVRRQIAAARAAVTGPLASGLSDIAAVTRALDSIDPEAQLNAVLGDMQAAFRQVTSTSLLRQLTALAGAAAPALTGSEADQQAALNEWAIERAFVRSALSATVAAAAATDWDVYDDAVALRDETADRITAEADLEDDPTAYAALVDLRAALIADLTTRAADLARLRTVTPSAVTSTLELAQMLYADPSRAEEIAARNGIGHPGFAHGPLRVLSPVRGVSQ